MQRKRNIKQQKTHYCLFLNRQAANFNIKAVEQLAAAIRKKGGYYSQFESPNEGAMYQTAMKCVGLRPWHKGIPKVISQRGKVTGIIACGGDSTANAIARASLKSGVPFGVIPMGRMNNIARSLYGTTETNEVIKKIVERNYVKIDVGRAGKRYFFCSFNFGLLKEIHDYLKTNNRPKFLIGWNKLTGELTKKIKRQEILLKVDAFGFDIEPYLFNINLMSNSSGLEISPLSLKDDGKAEVSFDTGIDNNQLGSFIKDTVKKRYNYSSEIKMFRGSEISLEKVSGMEVLIDGEKEILKEDKLRIKILNKKLNVLV